MCYNKKDKINNEYINRVNKVQDYIELNLNGDLSLDALSNISGFSKYHFSRIFKGIMNETIYSYINRVRLERALSFVINNRSISITDIAMTFGYSDSAVFARSFRKHFGLSASEVREFFGESKNCKANIKIPSYNRDIPTKGTILIGEIEVKTIREIKAIYLRHFGSYKELSLVFEKMVNELFRFAEQKNLLFDGSRPFAIYHDNPEFTLDQHLNTSVCLSINKEIKVNEKIGYMTIPSAKYAIAHFRLKPNQYREAWDYFYGNYLPRSGYQPDNAHVFEMYMSNPNDSVNRIHNTDIYLPVRSI